MFYEVLHDGDTDSTDSTDNNINVNNNIDKDHNILAIINDRSGSMISLGNKMVEGTNCLIEKTYIF